MAFWSMKRSSREKKGGKEEKYEEAARNLYFFLLLKIFSFSGLLADYQKEYKNWPPRWFPI